MRHRPLKRLPVRGSSKVRRRTCSQRARAHVTLRCASICIDAKKMSETEMRIAHRVQAEEVLGPCGIRPPRLATCGRGELLHSDVDVGPAPARRGGLGGPLGLWGFTCHAAVAVVVANLEFAFWERVLHLCVCVSTWRVRVVLDARCDVRCRRPSLPPYAHIAIDELN
jgi:hypothetical protein